MKKTIWMGVLLAILVVSPAMAIAVQVGETSQCWDFSQAPLGGHLVLPTIDQDFDNQFGDPIGMVNDMSAQGNLAWDLGPNDQGLLTGSAFKIILDIPNQPEQNPVKYLSIEMLYQGQIDFLWVQEISNNPLFNVVEGAYTNEDQGDGWWLYTQDFEIYPNPFEELVVIGLSGVGQAPTGGPGLAAVDYICIDTICTVPEPASMALLALGSMCVMKRKRK